MTEDTQKIDPATYTVHLKTKNEPLVLHNCTGTESGPHHIWFFGPLGPLVAILATDVAMVEFPQIEPPAVDEWWLQQYGVNDKQEGEWQDSPLFPEPMPHEVAKLMLTQLTPGQWRGFNKHTDTDMDEFSED